MFEIRSSDNMGDVPADAISFPVLMLREYPDPEDYLLHLQSTVRKIFEKDGYAEPILFNFTERDGKKMLMTIPVNPTLKTDDPDEAAVRRGILVRVTACSSSLVFFVCEGWMAKYSSETDLETVITPANLPPDQRSEVVLLNLYVDRARIQRVFHAVVTRDEDGKPSLGEWKEFPETPQGRLFISPEERAAMFAPMN